MRSFWLVWSNRTATAMKSTKSSREKRKTIETTPITINQDTVDEKQINVTISMGLAEFDNVESGENLFERADKALYEAKKNGRNQVRGASLL